MPKFFHLRFETFSRFKERVAGLLGLTAPGGIPEVSGITDAFTVTFTAGPYAGTYSTNHVGIPLTLALVSSSTQYLTLSVLSMVGAGQEGDVITGVDPLFVFETPNASSKTYQWQRDGVDIAGATSSSYTLVAADLGTDITRLTTFDGISVGSDTISIPPAQVSFSPADITSLVGDYDADDPAKVLVQNTDKVGNFFGGAGSANDFTALTNATRPFTGTASVNGGNAIEFNTGRYLLDTSSSVFYPSGSVVIAFRADASSDAADSIFSMYDNSQDFQIQTNVVGATNLTVNSRSHTNLTDTTDRLGQWIVLGYRWNASNGECSLWINGTSVASATDYNGNYPASPSRVVLGANRNINQQLDCAVRQLWIFDAPLTDTEMGNMHTHAQGILGI